MNPALGLGNDPVEQLVALAGGLGIGAVLGLVYDLFWALRQGKSGGRPGTDPGLTPDETPPGRGTHRGKAGVKKGWSGGRGGRTAVLDLLFWFLVASVVLLYSGKVGGRVRVDVMAAMGLGCGGYFGLCSSLIRRFEVIFLRGLGWCVHLLGWPLRLLKKIAKKIWFFSKSSFLFPLSGVQ